VSIDKVKDEIYDNNDELTRWCKSNLPDDFFKSTEEFVDEYKQAIEWANTRSDHFQVKALMEFSDDDNADAYLIAYAKSNVEIITIVTQEKSNPACKNRVLIPDCCAALDVNYCDLITLFRKLNETF
jgi:hypothetical protein